MPKLQTLAETYQKATKQSHMTSKGGKTNETGNPAATLGLLQLLNVLEYLGLLLCLGPLQ